MRTALVLLLALAALPLRADTPQIDAWEKNFDLWSLNGMWPFLDVPGNATTAELVAALAETQKKSIDADQFADWHIVETKLDQKVSIGRVDTLVVLIESAKGSKSILLFRHDGSRWLGHFYYLTTSP